MIIVSMVIADGAYALRNRRITCHQCGAIFGPAQQTAGTSANQVPSSSTSLASINSSHNTISSQDRGLPSIAAPRQPQIQEDVAFRRQDKGTSHTRVEPEPDIDADAEITQRLLKADKLPKSLFVNQEPSSSTAVVSINSSCNTIKPQDGGLPNSAAPRQPQMQQYKGTSHPQVEPELDIDADVEITQKLLKADKLLQSDSDNQGMTSSTAVSAIDTSCNTIISQDTGLPNSAAPREPQMQQDVALRQPDKTTSNSQVVPKPDADAEITEKLLREDKLLKSNCDGGSKECFPESPRKEYSSTMVTGAQYEVSSSEDEDVCPTCLEVDGVRAVKLMVRAEDKLLNRNDKNRRRCEDFLQLSMVYIIFDHTGRRHLQRIK
ncbi:putative MADS-box protein CMB1-like [Capsicum annuum]|uniref:Uncharacterized protein n=1 Tax=Capsicum annuum TaxID=4072 RepID=A0A2G2YD37_CAPAN|nr:putative MADS-box protein CMB1-like [Capsicum annuum]PHT67619.1 hypothetical protein T459_27106 [Capsicum annuum]